MYEVYFNLKINSTVQQGSAEKNHKNICRFKMLDIFHLFHCSELNIFVIKTKCFNMPQESYLKYKYSKMSTVKTGK